LLYKVSPSIFERVSFFLRIVNFDSLPSDPSRLIIGAPRGLFLRHFPFPSDFGAGQLRLVVFRSDAVSSWSLGFSPGPCHLRDQNFDPLSLTVQGQPYFWPRFRPLGPQKWSHLQCLPLFLLVGSLVLPPPPWFRPSFTSMTVRLHFFISPRDLGGHDGWLPSFLQDLPGEASSPPA